MHAKFLSSTLALVHERDAHEEKGEREESRHKSRYVTSFAALLGC